jgi:hypothetical protein
MTTKTEHTKELVKSYQEKTLALQEKSKAIDQASDVERHQLLADIESTLNDLKRDKEVAEVKNDATAGQQFVSFETQLQSMKTDITALSNPEATPPTEKNFFEKAWDWTKEKAGQAKDFVVEHPGRTVAGVGTLGLGFLVYRWYKKRKEKKATEQKNRTPSTSENKSDSTSEKKTEKAESFWKS